MSTGSVWRRPFSRPRAPKPVCNSFSSINTKKLPKRFPQPGHRPIEVVQLKRLDPLDGVLLSPDFRRPIAARGEQTVQDAQEHGPLEVEFELLLGRSVGRSWASSTAARDARTPTPPHADRLGCGDASLPMRRQHGPVLCKAGREKRPEHHNLWHHISNSLGEKST